MFYFFRKSCKRRIETQLIESEEQKSNKHDIYLPMTFTNNENKYIHLKLYLYFIQL